MRERELTEVQGVHRRYLSKRGRKRRQRGREESESPEPLPLTSLLYCCDMGAGQAAVQGALHPEPH